MEWVYLLKSEGYRRGLRMLNPITGWEFDDLDHGIFLPRMEIPRKTKGEKGRKGFFLISAANSEHEPENNLEERFPQVASLRRNVPFSFFLAGQSENWMSDVVLPLVSENHS